MKKQTDLFDLIKEYKQLKPESSKGILGKLADIIKEEGEEAPYFLSSLTKPGGALRLEDAMGETLRSWPSREKKSAATSLKAFAEWLSGQYDVQVDPEALPKSIPNLTERRLDMLRYLQKPRSMAQLEAHYLVSARTLRDDLNMLVNGWDILGTRINIKRLDEGGKITYNSSVHPLLLPLNLTEVYALGVGFPKALHGSVYREIADYLAEAVKSQLSGYALDILGKAEPGFAPSPALTLLTSYRQERDILRESRLNRLIYLMKRGQTCQLTWVNEKDEVKSAQGRLRLEFEDREGLYVGDNEKRIPLDRVLQVEMPEEYR